MSSPLEKDWMLGSIRPNTDGKGWSVTLINKKDRKQRVRFLPGFSADGFQLLEVNQDISNPKASKVQVRQGTQTAWISYDEESYQGALENGSTSDIRQGSQAFVQRNRCH